MPISGKILLSFLIIFFSLSRTKAQKGFGKLTVKISFDNEYVDFWDSLIIGNEHIKMFYKVQKREKIVIDSLPQGVYKITLKSAFNDGMSKTVKLKKKGNIQFSTANYYQPYTDTTTSLLDQMLFGDTARIYTISGMSWSPQPNFFMIVREGGRDKIMIKNEYGDWIHVDIMDYEKQDLKKLGTPEGSHTLSGLGTYYWVLHKKIMKHSCGSCMYGFLLRKRLVKMP